MKRILSPPTPTMIVPGAAHDGARDDLDDRVRLIMGCAGSKSAPSPRATRARYEYYDLVEQDKLFVFGQKEPAPWSAADALDACGGPGTARERRIQEFMSS